MFTNPEFWVGVSFVIALGLLLKLGGSNFIGALDAHGARIAAQLDEARKLREEAEALLAEQQRKQRDAINEAKDIIAHAHSEAERISGEAAAELERSLRLRELHARESIAVSEAKAVTEVRGVVVDIAIEAARRALTGHLDYQRGSALIGISATSVAASDGRRGDPLPGPLGRGTRGGPTAVEHPTQRRGEGRGAPLGQPGAGHRPDRVSAPAHDDARRRGGRPGGR